MSMKNSNDNIGNRTRNLPVCSAVPQPTASPRAPVIAIKELFLSLHCLLLLNCCINIKLTHCNLCCDGHVLVL